MAVMAVFRRNDLSAEQFAQFRAGLPLGSAPEGALTYQYARSGSTSVIVEVWEERTTMEAFFEQFARPGFERIGLPYVAPEVFDVDTVAIAESARRFEIKVGQPA